MKTKILELFKRPGNFLSILLFQKEILGQSITKIFRGSIFFLLKKLKSNYTVWGENCKTFISLMSLVNITWEQPSSSSPLVQLILIQNKKIKKY